MRWNRGMIIVLVFSTIVFGQQKMLTMKEAILGSYKNLKVANLKQLQWIADSDQFCYVDSLNGQYGLIRGGAADSNEEMWLSLDSLNSRLQAAAQDTVRKFPRIQWLDRHSFLFFNNKKLFLYDLDQQRVWLKNGVPEKAENIDLQKQTLRLAFTSGQNLYISTGVDKIVQVTHDSLDGISNGSNSVHRNEFGITRGTFWSPKGNYLAYYHLDRRMVTRYPLVDLDTRPAHLRMIRYPMTGMTSEQARVAIYHYQTGSVTYLQSGQPADHYLTNITWSPDEKYIYVVELNRDQNHLRLIQYDPLSGKPLRTILEERNDKWVEPEHGPLFINQDEKRFLWFSHRDGFNHLYLYDLSGKHPKALTKGLPDITRFLQFDKSGKYAFFIAASPDGLQRQAYRVKISGRKIRKITSQQGVHRVKPSKVGSYFLDTFSNHTTPRIISLLGRRGKVKRILLTAKNPLSAYKTGKINLIKIKNPQGTLLNGRIILPADFDPHKKYPVIVYVYGGPHGQMITDSWISGWRLWFQYMAERGYIIFTLDNRGTNARGLAFEQAIFRHLGTVEVADQMAGVRYLKSLSYVDSTRMGVHGWSYGGFMTISMLTRRPGIFKVAVAGGPVTDWRYYEVMYGERYMDTPQSNPDGYKEASLFNYIDNLKGNLLIIHGTVDPVVVWQNSLLYLRKAIDKGKQLDYFVYPGDEHNMRGKDRVHLYQKITDYFKLHL